MRADPADRRPRAGRRFEPAGVSQDACRQRRIHGPQPLQHGPGRRLADVEIGVVLDPLAPRRRQRHAGHQPHRDQVEQQVQFLGLQRIDPVIGGGDAAGDVDRRRLVQDGVGAGNRQLADGRAMDRIAEIDQAGDPRADRAIHQQVIVVGIAVDDLRPQPRQPRRHLGLEPVEEVLEDAALPAVLDELQPRPRPPRLLDVPVEQPMGAGVAEALQRAIQPAQAFAQAVVQLRCLPAAGIELPRQPAHQPHHVLNAAPVCLAQVLATQGRTQMRQRQVRIDRLHVAQQRGLEGQRLAVLRLVGDLQDPAGAVALGQPEVLVPLAVERLQGAGQPVEIARDAGDLLHRKARRQRRQDRHGNSPKTRSRSSTH